MTSQALLLKTPWVLRHPIPEKASGRAAGFDGTQPDSWPESQEGAALKRAQEYLASGSSDKGPCCLRSVVYRPSSSEAQ